MVNAWNNVYKLMPLMMDPFLINLLECVSRSVLKNLIIMLIIHLANVSVNVQYSP